MKRVRLSGHALGYKTKRGFTAAEVEEAVRTKSWHPAERGRLAVRKDFHFGAMWNGRYFETKQVRPVFLEEPAEILVITVLKLTDLMSDPFRLALRAKACRVQQNRSV